MLNELDARIGRLVKGAEEVIVSRVVIFLLKMKYDETPKKRKASILNAANAHANDFSAEKAAEK